MTTEIPSLWPDNALQIDTLSPSTILRVQATELGRLTKGILRGEVNKVLVDDAVEWQFDVVAPAAGNLRRRIATVHHGVDGAYPVQLVELGQSNLLAALDRRHEAASQEQFIQLLGSWLKSPAVVATVQSLIARSNEAAQPEISGIEAT
jgi:hypothetical protein